MSRYKLLIGVITAFVFLSFTDRKPMALNEEWGGIVNYKVGSFITEEDFRNKIDSLDKSMKKNEKLILDIWRESLSLEYQLTFDAAHSLFMRKESLGGAEDEGGTLARRMALTSISGKATYYKDSKRELRIKQHEYSGQLVNVKEPFKPYEWQIKDGEKEIAGFSCKKAVATVKEPTMEGMKERDITVWFTDDIPVAYGPMGIDGLPGLILQASLTPNFYMYASEVKVGRGIVNPKAVSLPKGGNEIDREDWDEFQKEENERIRGKH